MNDDLDSKTDVELNQAFSREVCGAIPDDGYMPDFCGDANIVIQWLAQHEHVIIEKQVGKPWAVIPDLNWGSADSFARAAAIALIRAAREKVKRS